jgi:DNA-binding response OmpR family regulator
MSNESPAMTALPSKSPQLAEEEFLRRYRRSELSLPSRDAGDDQLGSQSAAPRRNAMTKARILIVEDDASLAEVLDYNLTQEGYETQVAADGQQGLRELRLRCPDLVILDLMLPMIEGLEVCRLLRADPATSNVLVLMLTARSEESDELVGFSVGADDYVTKPFSVKVLLQRINALLRRKQQGSADRDVLVSQGIMIDRRRHRATAGDHALDLTPSEFGLLTALVRQPGRAFSRAELIDVALGDDALVLERTIDVHIRALRKKLGAHADLIQTVRGIGYRLRDPADVLGGSNAEA